MLDLIRRLLYRRHVPLEVEAYRRLQVKGFAPATIIDIGAYEGHWTRLARGVFPDVPALMVEAQPAKIPQLETVARELGGVTLVGALLSDRPLSRRDFR
jgi:hypothetical protein